MSEQSQGPGWWLASDGKWYPPEQAPAAPPPTTEQIGGPPAAGGPVGPPTGPPTGPPPGAGTPPGPGGPPPDAPIVPRSNNTAKIVAVIVALALVAGGVAFALTRDSGGSGGSVKAFCQAAKKAQNDDSLSKAGNDPQQIDKAIAAFDELVKASPKEIKSDMEALSDAVKKFAAAIKAAGNDPEKQFAAVLAASATLDQNKLETATKHIEEFGKKNCGADFKFDSSDSSANSGSTGSGSSFSFGTDFSFDSDSFSSVLSSFSSDFGSDFFSSLSSEASTSS